MRINSRHFYDFPPDGDRRRNYILIIILQALFVLHSSEVPAHVWKKPYETDYATIYYTRTRDLNRFAKNIGNSFLSFGESQKKNPMLARNRVDKMVESVRRLLDMYPSDLHFNIYVYPNFYELEAKYKGMGMLNKTPVAFYSHRERAVYLSAPDITDGVLAHEIAHAVINSFFLVPPPEKTQEVLARYVDEHLWAR